MDREDYAGLIYVLTNIVAILMFLAGLVVYLFYRQINIYLVAVGLLMLVVGFVAKKFIEEPKIKR